MEERVFIKTITISVIQKKPTSKNGKKISLMVKNGTLPGIAGV